MGRVPYRKLSLEELRLIGTVSAAHSKRSGAGCAGGSIAAEAMPLTQDSRLRSWPWPLGAVAFGLLLVVVAPPLVLILLVALGIFAFREERRASGNHLPLAIFTGLAVTAYVVLLLVLVHR